MNGPKYFVQIVILRGQKKCSGGGRRGKAYVAGQGQSAVHLMARGEFHEEIFR